MLRAAIPIPASPAPNSLRLIMLPLPSHPVWPMMIARADMESSTDRAADRSRMTAWSEVNDGAFQPPAAGTQKVCNSPHRFPLDDRSKRWRISRPSGRPSHDGAAGNLIERRRSRLPHDRSQFASQYFENYFDPGLAKCSQSPCFRPPCANRCRSQRESFENEPRSVPGKAYSKSPKIIVTYLDCLRLLESRFASTFK